MVHVTTERPSIGSALGSALGAFGANKLNRYQNKQAEEQQYQLGQKRQQEQQSILNQALSEAQQIYANPNLSPQQKQIGLYKTLTARPDIAQALSKQLESTERHGQTQKMLSGLFGGQQTEGQQPGIQQQPGNLPDNNQPTQGPQQKGFNPLNISDQQIAAVTQLDPNLGKVLQQQKEVALREQREQTKMDFEREQTTRKEEGEISKPILLELNQARKNIPLQEQAIIDIKEAAPNVNALDYFADITGFEPLRSAEGAKLKTGIKDFFLSDLTRVGARPNQWIEQQLADALPKIGRSTEANLITAEGLQFKVDLAKKRIETIDKLSEEDRKKYGYVKGDIDSRAYNDMKKYVIERQNQLQKNIKSIKKDQKGAKDIIKVKSPEGAIYEISHKDLEEAKSHGYESIE